jgi:hypothetical protein
MAALAAHPGDKQKVELLGRNRLIDELLRDNLEVALPIRDRGIDLIAYVDLGEDVKSYVAKPIQMKASWTRAFGIDRKYEKFPGLILAYVWHLDDREQAVTFAMSFSEARGVADAMGWTATPSWRKGVYSTSQPSKKLYGLLERFEMTPGAWRRRLMNRNENTPA